MNDPTLPVGQPLVPGTAVPEQEQSWHDPKDPLQLTTHPDPLVHRKGMPYTTVQADPRHIPLDQILGGEDNKEYANLSDDEKWLYPPEMAASLPFTSSPEDIALYFPEDVINDGVENSASDQPTQEVSAAHNLLNRSQ